jgi:cyclic pyranopterin phosphate synthase
LCRKGAVDFIKELRALPGVEQTTITTNGASLPKYVDSLVALGVEGINVSLDSLNEAHFQRVTRSKASIAPILESMARARAGGVRVKINTVPLQGYNDEDLPELVRYALENGYHIRFIELMPVGEGRIYEGVSQDAIRVMIEREFGRLRPLGRVIGNGPAECWQVGMHRGSVGFISAMSKKFCHLCNRMRFTSRGYLKTCLHHNIGVDLKPLLRGGAEDEAIVQAIVSAVKQKPKAHEFTRLPHLGEPKVFNMNSVGG